MNKKIKQIILPLCIVILAVVTACTSDDTTVATLTDYEAGEIQIDSMAGYNVYTLNGLKPGGHLTFDVTVDYIHPERLRYRWFLLRTYYNSYQAEQVGNVMKYPAADTICRQKKLEWDISQSAGTYYLYLMAEDSITGMKAYYRPTTSYISLTQEGNVGGLYLLTERDGQTDIEVYASPLMLIYGDSCYYKYYSNLAGKYLEGKPRWIRACTTGSTSKDGYLVATDKNLYRLNSVNMTQMNDWSTSFYDTPEVFDPQCAYYENSYTKCESLINDGKLYVLYTDKSNDRKYSSPIAGDYEAYPFLMHNTLTTWRAVEGAISSHQVIYDQKNRQFRPYYSKATSISNFKSTIADAYLDANKLPADPIAIFQTGGYYTAAIIDVEGTRYLYRYNFYNVVDDGDLSADGSRSIIDLSGCTNIMNAKLFTYNTAGYAFYYATDNAVYSFSPSTGNATSETVYTCEPGETVTAIYTWGSGGWPTAGYVLWVAVWDSNANEGKLIQYEMDVNYGVPNAMWGPMFGSSDNPVVTRGWGKIVSMTCADAE